MDRSSSLRLVFCTMILASCSRATSLSTLPPTALDGSVPAAKANYQSLYSFKGGIDGAGPYAGLVPFNGALYGTTAFGGGSGCGGQGCGTVFAVSSNGTVRIVYRFKGHPDGSGPLSSLIVMNGALYGTAPNGGRAGQGAVFEISASGKERVVYSFKNNMDGSGPLSSVTAFQGLLYGTTVGGGANGFGTVFATSTAGKERVLYSFEPRTDAGEPVSGLIIVRGALYGTTPGHFGPTGSGTVYVVTISGSERVLYRFKGRRQAWGNPGHADGRAPSLLRHRFRVRGRQRILCSVRGRERSLDTHCSQSLGGLGRGEHGPHWRGVRHGPHSGWG